MIRLAVFALFAIGCNAGGYGGQIGTAQLSAGATYGSGLAAAPLQYAQQSYGAPSYDAAIQTRRTVELRPLATDQNDYSQPQIIEVNPDHVPVQVHFRTGSSRVNVQQSHTPGAPAQVEHASFQDEPLLIANLAVFTLFAIGCNAGGYGGQLGTAQLSAGATYGSGLAAAPLQYAQQSYGAPSYDAAIQTRRTVELRPLATDQNDYSQPQIIEVNPDHVPVQVHFRTGSSRVNVQQSHTPGAPAQVEHASFQDEP
ncbi:unnamed protein product, partial [Oppiella nova]